MLARTTFPFPRERQKKDHRTSPGQGQRRLILRLGRRVARRKRDVRSLGNVRAAVAAGQALSASGTGALFERTGGTRYEIKTAWNTQRPNQSMVVREERSSRTGLALGLLKGELVGIIRHNRACSGQHGSSESRTSRKKIARSCPQQACGPPPLLVFLPARHLGPTQCGSALWSFCLWPDSGCRRCHHLIRLSSCM